MTLHENISALFNPESIAIVGASEYTGKTGNIILSNLVRAGYGGKIFPINPSGGIIRGLTALRKLEGGCASTDFIKRPMAAL